MLRWLPIAFGWPSQRRFRFDGAAVGQNMKVMSRDLVTEAHAPVAALIDRVVCPESAALGSATAPKGFRRVCLMPL